jgi:hypothetical protein
MVDLIDVQTIGIIIAAFSVIIGVINNILTSRQSNRTRQTQLFMDMYSHLRSKEFVKDSRELTSWKWDNFDDFRSKYGARANKEANSLFVSTSNYFDGIGVLVKRNEIDPKLVEDLMSAWIIWFWEKFGDVIKEYRKVRYPQYLEFVEYLYDRIKPLVRKEHPGLEQ